MNMHHPPAPVIPLHRPGTLAWRRARGLLTLRDRADRYAATHFARDPRLIAALPEDRRKKRALEQEAQG